MFLYKMLINYKFIENFKLLIIYWMFILLFAIKFNNFLMTLISIELLMLNTGCILLIWMTYMETEFYIIYFLVIMASESVFGLSLLIMMSRIYHNDSTEIMNIQW